MKKDTIITIIFVCIIVLMIFFINLKKNENIEINPNVNIEKLQSKIQIHEYPKAEVIEEYKGYKVCAKMEIPSINLETYILEEYSIKALNISPTKFWGVNPNEIGNFCVAGHNFINKNMFKNLKKLKIDDKIIVSDNNIGIIEYKIFDINIVLPNNTQCLEQETEGKREVTLITCTNDSQKRIIVKAREI